MEGISDIRISGIDETRPPRIRKEPYINLFFTLNHKAPKKWCEHFNDLLAKRKYPVRIDEDEGLYVDTWVRQMNEIVPLVDDLKEAVVQCSEDYIKRIEAENAAAAEHSVNPEDEGEQGKLNRILKSLSFED